MNLLASIPVKITGTLTVIFLYQNATFYLFSELGQQW